MVDYEKEQIKSLYDTIKKRVDKEKLKYNHILILGLLNNFDGKPIITARTSEDNRFACVLFHKDDLSINEILLNEDILKIYEVIFTCETWVDNKPFTNKVSVYGLK